MTQQNVSVVEAPHALRESESVRPAHQQMQMQDYKLPEKPAPESFIDPAILSFTKPKIDTRKVSAESHPSQPQHPDSVSPVMIADSIKQSPARVSHHESNITPTRIAQSSAAGTLKGNKPQKLRDRRDSTATATLTQPFDSMVLNEEETNLTGTGVKHASSTRGSARKNRRGATRKAKDPVPQMGPAAITHQDAESVQAGVNRPAGKGKGWRQTPLVEESTDTKPATRTKRSRHRPQKSLVEDTNGWATEDATDIQDLGDFDFEHNLSKFDKRRVFDDIRKEDIIDDDDRLVSFNRKTKPGTNGGRNLHYSENVLSPSDIQSTIWKSEAGETEEDEVVEEHYSSGRASRRDVSRRIPPSRKGTVIPGKSSATASPMNGSISSFRPSLRLASTNKPCSCVTPLQMLEIEQLCTSELGLTDEILSENAGRGIAETILSVHPSSLSPNPTILFLVGNHRSGSRAIAAARHLRNRSMRVSLCVLGGEREPLLLESLKRQLDMYRRSGGWTVRWDDFQAKLSAAAAASSSTTTTTTTSSGAQPGLIVDALLGMHATFAELRTDDQAIVFESICWANRSMIPILSVDVPSGLHASTGEVTVVDGAPLVVHASYVACLAAPKSGLLTALGAGEARSLGWRLSVVDVGISNAAWKKYGTRRRQGVDFGKEWVVHLAFVSGGGLVGAGLDAL